MWFIGVIETIVGASVEVLYESMTDESDELELTGPKRSRDDVYILMLGTSSGFISMIGSSMVGVPMDKSKSLIVMVTMSSAVNVFILVEMFSNSSREGVPVDSTVSLIVIDTMSSIG